MPDRRNFYESRSRERLREANRGYHRLLQHYYSLLIPPGMRVLEIGSGLGDVLSAVSSATGIGLDFSPSTVELARARHPDIEFICVEACSPLPESSFDYLIASDLINDLTDVQKFFENLHSVATTETRLVLNFYNTLWRPILGLAERLGFKAPTIAQNWLSLSDVQNLLMLAGWEVVRAETRILWPLNTPIVGPLFNRWLAPLLKHLCLTQFLVARPSARARREASVSIIIPARNESGNIEAAVRRLPDFGSSMEIIFVEGHSTDDTWKRIQDIQARFPEKSIKAFQQKGRGKGDAVRLGFEQATGDILFILDADLTVPPEELPKFYEVLAQGKADFVNGVRLVYPCEQESMQFLNMIANKLFGLCFSWMLGQTIKDTLCGTKVLWRSEYEKIARNRKFFGDFDPFGDFDLLFGAARLNLKIIDLPIRYQARSYGQTNISRWKHGWLLLRMVLFAARRIRFV